MKKILLIPLLLTGCATPFPYDTGPGAATGTMVGGAVGYTIVESAAATNPILSILGAIGGAAIGRSVGTTIDERD